MQSNSSRMFGPAHARQRGSRLYLALPIHHRDGSEVSDRSEFELTRLDPLGKQKQINMKRVWVEFARTYQT